MALNSVQNSTETTEDAASPTASPTTKVLAYLRSKGMPPSSANVRAALEANARDPGVIPGLRSDTAATEADDQAAMRGGPSVGGRGSAASEIEAPSKPTTRGNPGMADLTAGPTNEAKDTGSTTKVSSAAPSSDTGQPVQRVGPDDFSSFITPAAIAAAAIGGGAIPGMMGRGAQFVGNAQPASGVVTDVNPTAIAGSSNPMIGQDTAALPPPSSMEQAMQQATAPARGVGAIAGAGPASATPAPDFSPISGINPNVGNPAAMGNQPLPAGINPYDVNASVGSGPTTTMLPENVRGAPPVPLRPVPPGPWRGAANPGIVEQILKGMPALKSMPRP